jgi:hypothetical protein
MAIDEMSGFIIIVVLIAILLLWPTINCYRSRYFGCGCRQAYRRPYQMTPVYLEGLETKTPLPETATALPYNELIQKKALEPSVKESHQRFISEAPHRTTTSSMDTERDDPNDVNPWVGLKRPKYYDPIANTQAASRIVSSETPDQMPNYRKIVI